MKHLQKLGKALMLPVAALPICGILMGIGYALCPSTMQGGDVEGFLEMLGFFLVKAGGALIEHLPLLFVVGVGVGMADAHDGSAGLAALASWLL
ncbi:MAG: PTS transporter subunit EIIC, partial [Lachnospiraceae bacterium]|nr:PTS transporter subunit EIIC [Lachnospiraceae bacterium]